MSNIEPSNNDEFTTNEEDAAKIARISAEQQAYYGEHPNGYYPYPGGGHIYIPESTKNDATKPAIVVGIIVLFLGLAFFAFIMLIANEVSKYEVKTPAVDFTTESSTTATAGDIDMRTDWSILS